jgi:hypothetical protein
VLLADNISASAHKQPGDATLVFRSTTFTDGEAPGSGFDLYTDSGPYYWAPTKSGLAGQITAHHDLADGLFTREIAAAEYAVHGDLATARERMADAPDPASAGKSPSAQMSPTLLKVKAEMLGVKAAPGQSLAAAYDKAYTDSWVWSDATEALEAGAGNPQVRAGVLRLLSTVSGVVVTNGTFDGQPTLVVGDVTPGLNGARAAPGGRGPGRVRAARGSGSTGQGRSHCWFVLSAQVQIWTWVPEPPKPVSSRHLPDSGLTSSPLDWACHCWAPVPLQL